MSDLAGLLAQREQAREAIELRDAALKLTKNREFKKVILEHFFVTETARYAQISGDPALSKESREDALNLAQASGHTKRFLSVLVQMGNAAESNLAAIEQAILEVQMEGGE